MRVGAGGGDQVKADVFFFNCRMVVKLPPHVITIVPFEFQ